MDIFSQLLDDNWGCLPREQEWSLLNRIKDLLKVEDFKTYYEWIGVGTYDDQAMQERLHRAVTNSRNKKYHGPVEEMNAIPIMPE